MNSDHGWIRKRPAARWTDARNIAAGMILVAVLLAAASKARERPELETEEWPDVSRMVSVDFVDVELKNALSIIARTSGLNIIAGSEIDCRVTARLVEVDLHKALNSILQSCGYSYVHEGEIIRVFKIPEEIVGLHGKTPQVLIESRIVEISLGERDQAGVAWDTLTSLIGDEVNITGKVNLNLGTSGLILNIFNGDVTALLNLISKETNTNVLSSPRIVALDGREAKILVGEKVAYQQSFGQSTAGITTTTVQFEDVGIKLYVTPHVRPGGFVVLDLLIEVSTVKEWRTLSNGDEIPIISTKNATSRVRVADNATLIIGGLINEERVESIWKVPILGDIPLLKYFFRRKTVETDRKELTLFITPRIMDVAAVEDMQEKD